MDCIGCIGALVSIVALVAIGEHGLALFVLCDLVGFCAKLACVTDCGTCNSVRALRLMRRVLLWRKKPGTPFGMEDPCWWAYDLIVETAMASACYLAVIVVFPISLILPHDMLNTLLFPIDESIWFAMVLGALQVCEFTIAVGYANFQLGHQFPRLTQRLCGEGGAMVTLSVACTLWAPWNLVTLGWTFRHLKVGPFEQ